MQEKEFDNLMDGKPAKWAEFENKVPTRQTDLLAEVKRKEFPTY